MTEPNRTDPSPQQAAETGAARGAEAVTVGRDDPAPPAPDDEEKQPTPTPRRDNQGEAITGAPVV
jgi:hypothetical protein